ncbi:hypothetical protein BGX21_000412 [Mortierella sp. AD011]|nr:hypothetical protein BGX20_010279 [Mortierella sp. AD010]KAF9401834.1 hypothetical protein BGX21_000412 [Mortierella sp. AD011]
MPSISLKSQHKEKEDLAQGQGQGQGQDLVHIHDLDPIPDLFRLQTLVIHHFHHVVTTANLRKLTRRLQVQGVRVVPAIVGLDPGHTLDLDRDRLKESDRVIILPGTEAGVTTEAVVISIEAGAGAVVETETRERVGTGVGTGVETGVETGARIQTVVKIAAIAITRNRLVPEETLDHAPDLDHGLHRATLADTAVVATTITVAAAARAVEVTIGVNDLDDPDLDLGLGHCPPIDLAIPNLLDLNQTVIVSVGSTAAVAAKSKKERKSHSSKAYGTYGILTPADMWNKENEFQAWLMEVKKLNPETIPHNKMKDHFIGFMEDYNTVTMPHEKFYNLTKWEDRQRAIRMGEPLPESAQGSVNLMNDEEMLRMKQRDKRKMNISSQPQVLMTQSQLQELRKVSHERVEADKLRKMGFDAGRKGVRYE